MYRKIVKTNEIRSSCPECARPAIKASWRCRCPRKITEESFRPHKEAFSDLYGSRDVVCQQRIARRSRSLRLLLENTHGDADSRGLPVRGNPSRHTDMTAIIYGPPVAAQHEAAAREAWVFCLLIGPNVWQVT